MRRARLTLILLTTPSKKIPYLIVPGDRLIPPRPSPSKPQERTTKPYAPGRAILDPYASFWVRSPSPLNARDSISKRSLEKTRTRTQLTVLPTPPERTLLSAQLRFSTSRQISFSDYHRPLPTIPSFKTLRYRPSTITSSQSA
ncbi:hypothetical protein OF83DRAFT_574850 [Amylostereum chailletii]|nr:hypothetical protein OF83DRAFT_574850 [Amylostereum chailletii]